MRTGILLGTILGCLALPARAAGQSPLFQRVSATLAGLEGELIEVRRDLHRHPEVSGQERRTAGVVAERLRKLGLEVRTGVGGHGVVGVLRGGGPGPIVAYRADMDAVYSNAPDPVEFRSETPGVRHICGHDLHTTVGLALAAGLASVRAELPGTVVFVFQPAEENVTGARAMLADGAFSPLPAAVFGLHTAPLPVGQLGTMPGTMMAWRDRVAVRITGSGDLGVAADTVSALIRSLSTVDPSQAVVPRQPPFLLAQVAPVGETADSRTVNGSISVADDASSARANSTITARIGRLALPEVSFALEYTPRWVPGVTNDAGLTSAATASIRRALGADAVVDVNSISPAFSEDYGAFQAETPGVFFYLGVGSIGMPHSPGYVADEAAIVFGARAMAAAVLDRLAGSPGA